jgi:hypothetical protein
MFPKGVSNFDTCKFYATLLETGASVTQLRDNARYRAEHLVEPNVILMKKRGIGFQIPAIHRQSVVAIVSDVTSRCCIYYS